MHSSLQNSSPVLASVQPVELQGLEKLFTRIRISQFLVGVHASRFTESENCFQSAWGSISSIRSSVAAVLPEPWRDACRVIALDRQSGFSIDLLIQLSSEMTAGKLGLTDMLALASPAAAVQCFSIYKKACLEKNENLSPFNYQLPWDAPSAEVLAMLKRAEPEVKAIWHIRRCFLERMGLVDGFWSGPVALSRRIGMPRGVHQLLVLEDGNIRNHLPLAVALSLVQQGQSAIEIYFCVGPRERPRFLAALSAGQRPDEGAIQSYIETIIVQLGAESKIELKDIAARRLAKLTKETEPLAQLTDIARDLICDAISRNHAIPKTFSAIARLASSDRHTVTGVEIRRALAKGVSPVYRATLNIESAVTLVALGAAPAQVLLVVHEQNRGEFLRALPTDLRPPVRTVQENLRALAAEYGVKTDDPKAIDPFSLPITQDNEKIQQEIIKQGGTETLLLWKIRSQVLNDVCLRIRAKRTLIGLSEELEQSDSFAKNFLQVVPNGGFANSLPISLGLSFVRRGLDPRLVAFCILPKERAAFLALLPQDKATTAVHLKVKLRTLATQFQLPFPDQADPLTIGMSQAAKGEMQKSRVAPTAELRVLQEMRRALIAEESVRYDAEGDRSKLQKPFGCYRQLLDKLLQLSPKFRLSVNLSMVQARRLLARGAQAELLAAALGPEDRGAFFALLPASCLADANSFASKFKEIARRMGVSINQKINPLYIGIRSDQRETMRRLALYGSELRLAWELRRALFKSEAFRRKESTYAGVASRIGRTPDALFNMLAIHRNGNFKDGLRFDEAMKMVQAGACPALVCVAVKYADYDQYLKGLQSSTGQTENDLSKLVDSYAKRLGIVRG